MYLASSNIPFQEKQLQFIFSLIKKRPDQMNDFLSFLNYFDSPYFFYILIPTIWLGFSYKWGMRIYYWSTLNSALNVLAKTFFQLPRPSTMISEVGLLHPSSYGFPSGGAQTCIFLGALLIYYRRSPLAWTIGILYIFAVSISRIYLGVHFPMDVLGGWFFGGLLVISFIYLKKPIDQFFSSQSKLFNLSSGLAASCLIAILDPIGIFFAGFMAGVSIGTYFSLKYNLFLEDETHILKALPRALFAVSSLWLLLCATPSYSGKSFLIGLFMTLLISPCYRICREYLLKNGRP